MYIFIQNSYIFKSRHDSIHNRKLFLRTYSLYFLLLSYVTAWNITSQNRAGRFLKQREHTSQWERFNNRHLPDTRDQNPLKPTTKYTQVLPTHILERRIMILSCNNECGSLNICTTSDYFE